MPTPYRRYKKRVFKKKKRYYKKRSLAPPTASGQLIGYPRQQVAKLRYIETFNINSPLGVFTSHTFRANSIFDPNYAVGGTTPTGYTLWNSLYKQYIVLGSKITCKFAFHNNDGLPTQIGVYVDDTPAISTTNTDILERTGRCRVLLLTPYVNGGQTNRTITGSFSAKKFFNVKDIKDNQTRFGAEFGTNPLDAESAFYHVFNRATLGGNTSAVVVIKIDYIALFSEPRLLET